MYGKENVDHVVKLSNLTNVILTTSGSAKDNVPDIVSSYG